MNSDRVSTTRRWAWGVAKQLREGERVEIEAQKDRTLTVAQPAQQVEREPYRCNGLVVRFEGYGTEYTLEVPENEGKPVRLLYPSKPGIGEIVRDIEQADGAAFGIVAEKTAADMGIPER